jgi:peptide-methionine (S)-S-oxide reductase
MNNHSMMPPLPAGMEIFYCGLGCFWSAERLFWRQIVVKEFT